MRPRAALLQPLQPHLCGHSCALTHVCVWGRVPWAERQPSIVQAALGNWDSQLTQGTGNSSIHISESCWKASHVLVWARSEHPLFSSYHWGKSTANTSSAWLAADAWEHRGCWAEKAVSRRALWKPLAHRLWKWPWIVCTYLFTYSREESVLTAVVQNCAI